MRTFQAFARILCAALALLAFSAAPAVAQQPKPQRAEIGGKPESILWVGNSFFYYNNSMHGHVGLLAGSLGDRLRGTSVTISGSGLNWQDMDALLAPGKLGSYSFVGDNEVKFNSPGRQYDTVMMMDCSQCPVNPQLQKAFHDTAKLDAQIVRKHDARPVLFMTWAYKDKPEMTAQLAAQYTEAGNANDMLVVPAGLAFAASVAKKPELELYAPDKRHPSLAGTYLAACTVYATLMKKSPVGATYIAGLPPETARHLQQVAWDTVQDYFAR